MVSPLYQVEKTCPICEKAFTVTKTRGQMIPVKTDTDFCTHYKDLNPYYYAIWLCPHCGFAAHEDRFFTLLESQREKLKQFLSGRQVNLDFSGARTWEQAVTSHKLAIYYANMVSLPASHVASLTLRLAWLYREKEQSAEEQDMLQKAIDAYKAAFLKEKMPIGGNLSEITLTYLIGELLRRVGSYEEALSYLGRVVSNPQAKNEKRILDLAREAWHEARDAKKTPDAGQDTAE
jgi:uncharacterized protein (DUF2225 family)